MATRVMTGLVALVVVAAAGCKTAPEIVPSTGPRQPTSPDQVKIYQAQPLRYEKLGLVVVTATRETPWDNKGNADSGFERLKTAAAAKGANGLLLMVDPKEQHGTVVAGYHSTYYEVPYRLEPQRAAVAEAIYVLKEH